MKTLMTVALALLIFLSNSLEAAQTAEGRLYCFSIRFGSGQGQFGLYKMDLTGTYPTKNGELYPIAHDTFSHYSTLIFTDETDEEIPGDLLLDVPFSDNNDDGFNDIFETALAFSGGSSGTYSFPGGFSGSINATWSRNAGSYAGTCQLHFQHLGMFTHTFNVLEYKGSITYTPGTSVVLATVEFGLSGVPGYQLKGPISFTKWIGDPQNELDFDGGDWTNAVPVTPEVFSFFGDTLVRDISRPNGLFVFDDWLLTTDEADYYFWEMSVNDLNDSDSDGIPDFSDDPQNGVVRRPLLALARTENNLQLTISGDVGQTCQIQQSAMVNALVWPTISSVTLTNDPQTISLPLPTGEAAFWRIQVQ